MRPVVQLLWEGVEGKDSKREKKSKKEIKFKW